MNLEKRKKIAVSKFHDVIAFVENIYACKIIPTDLYYYNILNFLRSHGKIHKSIFFTNIERELVLYAADLIREVDKTLDNYDDKPMTHLWLRDIILLPFVEEPYEGDDDNEYL